MPEDYQEFTEEGHTFFWSRKTRKLLDRDRKHIATCITLKSAHAEARGYLSSLRWLQKSGR